MAVYSVVRGDGRRMLFGYDSFGNTCNQEFNAPIENLTYSGMNTKGKPCVVPFVCTVFCLTRLT